jgi:DNA-binding MarR family transcriptional regulator
MSTIDIEGDDMPRVYLKVLAAIKALRTPRVRTIAAHAGISRSYAQRIIHKLAEHGAIRIESDPGCRLEVSIPATPKRSRNSSK